MHGSTDSRMCGAKLLGGNLVRCQEWSPREGDAGKTTDASNTAAVGKGRDRIDSTPGGVRGSATDVSGSSVLNTRKGHGCVAHPAAILGDEGDVVLVYPA